MINRLAASQASGHVALSIARYVSVALFFVTCGCSQNAGDSDAHSPAAEPSLKGRDDSDRTNTIAWIDWSRGPLERDVIFIDSSGEAFHYSTNGKGAILHVYRNVRLPADALQQLRSVSHAATFNSAEEWSDFRMRLSVVCTDDAGCSIFQCNTQTDSLFVLYRLLEEALTTGEERSVTRAQYDQLPLDRDLFPRDLSEIIEGCKVAEIRPGWIEAAWDRADRSTTSEQGTLPIESTAMLVCSMRLAGKGDEQKDVRFVTPDDERHTWQAFVRKLESLDPGDILVFAFSENLMNAAMESNLSEVRRLCRDRSIALFEYSRPESQFDLLDRDTDVIARLQDADAGNPSNGSEPAYLLDGTWIGSGGEALDKAITLARDRQAKRLVPLPLRRNAGNWAIEEADFLHYFEQSPYFAVSSVVWASHSCEDRQPAEASEGDVPVLPPTDGR